MFRYCLLFWFLLPALQLAAQRDVKDSLLLLLETNISPQERVDVLNELSYQYYDYQDSIAMVYAEKALAEATELNYLKGIKYAYTLVALGYTSKSMYRWAIRYYKMSDAVQAPDSEGIAVYNLTLLGNTYRDQAKYDSAIRYYQMGIHHHHTSEAHHLATLYKNVAEVYIRLWQNDKALKYLDSADNILKSSGHAYSSLGVWSSYGKVYENLLQFEKARYYNTKMCDEARKLEDYFHQIKCFVRNSQLNYRRGDFSNALRNALEALKLLESYSYPPQQVEVYVQIGAVYIELGDFDNATKFLFKALAITEKHGLSFETGQVFNELAWVYKEQGNYPLALDYLEQSQSIRESIGDQQGVASCHNIRGLIYYLQKRYQASLDEHEIARQIRLGIHHAEGVAASIFNMSLVYVDLNNIDKAMSLIKESIAIEEKIDNIYSISLSYNHLASLLIAKGKLSEAQHYLERSQKLARQTNSKPLLRYNADNLSKLYEAKGDFRRALEYRKQYQELNDSIFSEVSAIKAIEMNALYQVEKKNQEIQLLNNERALQQSELKVQKSQLRFQLLIIVSVVIGLFLISVVLWIVYRNANRIKTLNRSIREQSEELQTQAEELSESNKSLSSLNSEVIEKNEEIQAQSEELIEANQTIAQINKGLEDKIEERTVELRQAYKELDTFFYRASHDFRRPLTTFMGLSEVAKITVKDQNALELFSKVNDTAHYLDKMLIKLQSISDVGGQELVYKEIFLKEIFDSVCDNFREDLKRRGIRTFCDIDLKGPFYSYPALLRIIIENLVENSIFFCQPTDPFIRLKAYSAGDEVVIEVTDNGEGISGELKDRLFEMYFRGSERSKGNGLGLYIVKKAVEKLNGSISVTSKLYEGSCFTVRFPEKKN